MLNREVNPMVKPESIVNTSWNLPSVRDLLHPASTHQDAPRRHLSPPLCSICLSRDMRVTLGEDGACSQCSSQRHPAPYQDQARPQHPGPNLSFYKSGSGYQDSHSKHAYRPQTIDTSLTAHQINTPLVSPLYTPLTTANSSPSYTLNNSLIHQSHQLTHRTSLPNLQSRTAQVFSLQRTPSIPSGPTTTANKVASANRHKLSEKHRRDEQGAFITAGHVLCSGMDPGVMVGCQICIAESQESSTAPVSANVSFSSSITTAPSLSISSVPDASNNVTATQLQGKPKIAKNIMLEDGLMWQFSMIMHMAPHSVADRLEVLRTLARTMEEEKRIGIGRKLSAGLGPGEKVGKKNWDADVRGEKLLGLIARMEEMCASHGVAFGGWGDVKMEEDVDVDVGRLGLDAGMGLGKRRRGSDGVEDDMRNTDREDRFAKRRFGDVPTPPSSTGSPRPATNEEEGYRSQ